MCSKNWYNTMVNGLSWGPATSKCRHVIKYPTGDDTPTALTADHEMADTPNGMRVGLLDNQRVLLAALLDYERNTQITHNNITAHHDGILLTEAPGSGKTILCIALICMKIMPTKRSLMYPLMYTASNRVCSKNNTTCVIKKFPDSRIIPCTIITVASSVFEQWHTEIVKHTDLRILRVGCVVDYRVFYNMVNSDIDGLKAYDIILVKLGKMSNMTESKYIEPMNTDSSVDDIYKKVAETLRSYVFWRVINDDIDMSKLPIHYPVIHAFSTIHVSATGKTYRMLYNNTNYGKRVDNPMFHLKFPFMDIINIIKNQYIQYMSLSCESKFLIQSLQRVNIRFKLHKIYNTSDKLITMIGNALRSSDSAVETIEMLNSGLVTEAAERMGMCAVSVGDIFRRIIGDRSTLRKSCQDTLKFIEGLDLDNIDTLSAPPPGDEYTSDDFYTFRPILYKYDGFDDSMDKVWDKCIADLKCTDVLINRMKEDLCGGTCLICDQSIDKQIIAITLCCGKTLHQLCAFATSNMRTDRQNNIVCLCPHCKSTHLPANAFITVDGCNMTDIIKYDDGSNCDDVPFISTDVAECKRDTKLDRMVSIINDTLAPDSYDDIKSQYGVTGMVDKPPRPSIDRQTVIFTRFSETITHISSRLDEEKIPYRVFEGTAKRMNNILVDYKNGMFKVLIINGENNAAGITLSFVDNLIFMHHIKDVHISKQIVGRIDRYGREYEGYVHLLYHDNECRYM